MASIWDWSTTPGDNDDADTSINWVENQAANTVNNSARQMMARVAEFIRDLAGVNTVAGTNALTLVAASSFTALAEGRTVAFKAAATNTGTVTLNVNSTGAKSVTKFTTAGEETLAAGDIQAGGVYVVRYSATGSSGSGSWLLLSSPMSGTISPGRISMGPSGTPGLFTDGADGLVGIGTTSPAARLDVRGTTATTSRIDVLRTTGSTGARVASTGSEGIVTTTGAGALALGANENQYTRVTQDGHFLVSNLTSPLSLSSTTDEGLSWNNSIKSAAISRSGGAALAVQRTTSNGDAVVFFRNTTNVGSISVTTTATAYNTSSDYRLKENLRTFNSGALIDGVEMWHYDWKAGGTGYGALAHELQAVVPDAVTGEKDGEQMQVVDYSKLVPIMWAEIRKLRQRLQSAGL